MDSPGSSAVDTAAAQADSATGNAKVPPLYWLLLAMAVVAEVAATSLLKSTEGFTQLWPSVIVICFYELSFVLLTVVVRKVAVPVVYATWGGVGVAMVTIVAWGWLGQQLDAAALLGIGLIALGVIVIQGFSKTTHA